MITHPLIHRTALLIAIASAIVLVACGQKGDLYLPPPPATTPPTHSPVTPAPASETHP